MEGDSDADSLRVFTHRLTHTSERSVARVLGRGGLLNARKVLAHISDLRRGHRHLEKILACIDCEDYPLAKVQGAVSDVVAQIHKLDPKVVPEYVIVMHALEAWTGGDYQALRSYLGAPPRAGVRAIKESDPHPKETLRRLFRRHPFERQFVETVDNPRLAEIVLLETLRKSNSSYAIFEQKVIDP